MFAKINQAPFDAEAFIDVIETIEQTLPEVGPRRLADNVLSLIHPEPGAGRRAPIIDAWEAMPAVTRVKVEAVVQDTSQALVSWLKASHTARATPRCGIDLSQRGPA